MALERFHFTRSNGEEREFPYLMDTMGMRKLHKLQKKYKDDPEQLTEELLTSALGKKVADEILDDWSMRDSTNFMQGWMDDEDAPVGE
ncbi:hypothetical protein [Corynebacterium tapiri]|uniref:Uncharacterized protein n=1 Tax=Corynebacterium tapiri TaxID=1448266 RepID=A0A5C4U5Z4_9CORY|nr:hypothetical protein [Corynebacterium tapiri]TNL98773.1 hypothetical protein FHE74_03910 [Corynebacterium tapiri]